MYSPTTARWMGRDPLGLDGGDSNLYRYVEGKSTGRTDPSGLTPSDACGRSGWKPRKPNQCVYGPSVLFEADFVMYDQDRRCGISNCRPHIMARYGGSSECHSRVSWPLDCVCKNMPDDKLSNCIRGCLWCIFRKKGSAADFAEHEWCIDQCSGWFNWFDLYQKLDVAIHCCATKHGKIVGPGTGKPPSPGAVMKAGATSRCDQCGAGPTRPIDCSGY
jgi:hypothetical protein